MAPLHKIIKWKLGLSSSTPNSVIQAHEFYRMKPLIFAQEQNQLAEFLDQLNDDNVLGSITSIRLKQIQYAELQSQDIRIAKIQHLNRSSYRSYIRFMLYIAYQRKISFTVHKDQVFNIFGGKIALCDILPRQLLQDSKKLLTKFG